MQASLFLEGPANRPKELGILLQRGNGRAALSLPARRLQLQERFDSITTSARSTN